MVNLDVLTEQPFRPLRSTFRDGLTEKGQEELHRSRNGKHSHRDLRPLRPRRLISRPGLPPANRRVMLCRMRAECRHGVFLVGADFGLRQRPIGAHMPINSTPEKHEEFRLERLAKAIEDRDYTAHRDR